MPSKFTALFVLLFALPFARPIQASTSVQEALSRPVPYFSQDGEAIGVILQSLGRANGLSIVADADVKGTVSLEMNETTVRGVLDAILRPNGYYYEEQEGGWLLVQKFKTVIYALDYPQSTRSGTSTSSVTMGGQSSNSNGNSGGLQGAGLGAALTGGAGGGNNGQTGGGGGSGNDSTSINISQKNESDFWKTVEDQATGLLGKEEKLFSNRFAGLITVSASSRTHRLVSDYIDRVNDRVGVQVEIEAKIVEVTLSNASKLGIDWNVAQFSIGKLVNVGTSVVPPGGTVAISGVTANTNVTSAGGFQFSQDTLAGTVSSGKVDVVIRALQEQGNVSVTSQPRLRLLNNQTGYIKDTNDKPFFKTTSKVTINAGGATIAGTQPITQNQYEVQTISIGTVLPITVQISDDDTVKLDVTPAISRLRGIVFSPDNQQTQPDLDVKQISTIVSLRPAETAIIGGLITDSKANTNRSVPGLSKIPIIGKAFQSEGKSTARTELVIFIKPTVIRNGAKYRKPEPPLAVQAAPKTGSVQGIGL